MPQQYGTNGISSDGSLMNVGNQIWDPAAGGRPSIKLFPQYSSGVAMSELLSGGDPPSDSSPSHGPKARPKAKSKVQEELEQIYRDHCPEKSATEVAGILVKFAGREEELLLKVRDKYLPTGVVQTQQAREAPCQLVASDRDAFSGATMADLLSGIDMRSRDGPVSSSKSVAKPARNQQNQLPTSTKQMPKASNAPDEFAQANLYRGAQEGNMKLVKLAIESDGADVNGRNEKDGCMTALHYASQRGNFRMVEYLLQVKGADKTVPDAKGITAAEFAKTKDIGALLGRADCTP